MMLIKEEKKMDKGEEIKEKLRTCLRNISPKKVHWYLSVAKIRLFVLIHTHKHVSAQSVNYYKKKKKTEIGCF